jgi:hypothetical protein
MTTTVEVLFFEGCPNHRPAMELARDVVARVAPHALVEEVEVRNNEEAARLRFLGSPTIHLDGVDIEPEARSRTDYAMSCRVYGGSGLPPCEMIEAALAERQQ